MDFVKNINPFFVSCPVEISELLSQELQDLLRRPLEDFHLHRGGVTFEGTIEEAFKVILLSRLASKVFLKIKDFQIRGEKGLYREGKKIPWSNLIKRNQGIKIKTIIGKDALRIFKNSQYLNYVLKDAIVDHFKAKGFDRPQVNLKNPDLEILTRIDLIDDEIRTELYLDLCGKPLSHRGYRAPYAKAPVRENLAAAILMMTEWKPDKEILMDSMCGSGTFLMEAALLMGNIPPQFIKLQSIIRDKIPIFSFEGHHWFKTSSQYREGFYQMAKKAYEDSEERIKNLPKSRIYGSDLNRREVSLAKETVQYLGKSGVISLKESDALDLRPPFPGEGVILCNPPYGERMGEIKELENLYHEYGETLKKHFTGFRAYIFSGNLPLRKKIALGTSKRIPLRNGNIECRLWEYNLY